MSLDDRLTQAMRDVADRVVPPLADVEAVRSTVRRSRVRLLSLVAVAAFVAVLVAVSALLGGRDLAAPPRPAGSSTVVVMSLPQNGDIAAGTYAIPKPTGSVADYVRLIVTLPGGWATGDGVVHKRLGLPGAVELSAWTVSRVYDDPCHWQTSSQSETDLGVDGQHAMFHRLPTGSTLPTPARGGLANQKGRSASGLTKVTLGGQAAVKIELSIPVGLDLATCDKGEFRDWPTWDGAAGDGNARHAPGQIDVVNIVDVDRMPLIIDASRMPATSAADRAELEAVLASIIIDRGH